MKKIFITLLLLIFIVDINAQQVDMTKEIPVDNKTLVGKLPNGITYYLRHNEEPKQRASFYIIRDAGALLENDEQNGLAHFLEHMAFNGSKNFPGNSLISTLERHGISFGGNLNAYTSQNETVYNISSVPTTDKSLIDTCLLVLHDWSYYLTLNKKDIDDERGVISEEWRTRRNSRARIFAQQAPILFKDSKYAIRDVIGSYDVINNFKPETIRDFYHKWYRTDLEAIAIVGDFDVKEMEAKIKKVFTPIPAVKNPVTRPFFEIPYHKETYYSLATDKEVTSSNVSVVRIIKDKPTTNKVTYKDIKDGLINAFFNAMISNRIGEKIQKGESEYLQASISKSKLVRGYSAYSISAVAKPNMEKEAFTEILQENERIVQHGFTDSELERLKINIKKSFESALKDADKTTNESYINDIKNNFLEGDGIITIEDYCKAANEILPTITSKEISDKVKEWWQADNRIIMISGSSKDSKHLTETEANAIINSVKNTPVKAYKDASASGSLIDEKLSGSPIVKSKDLNEFGAKEWTLKNGAKVVYRKASYEKDNVSLYSYSPGGTSQYEVKDLLVASNVCSFLRSYGLGKYDDITLGKILTGKNASTNVSINSLYESVSGNSSPEDIETMFQLIYLRFQNPRFDSKAHNVMLNRSRIMLKQSKGQPGQIMNDSLRLILNNYSPRAISLDENNISDITIEKIEKIYKDRFKDASDFTFFIVGNVDEDVVKPLVEKYIGSIPSTYRHEKWIDRKVRAPKGKVEKIIKLPLETPKATVLIKYSKEMKTTLKDNYCLTLLKSILSMRFLENIREKEGGTYGVSVNGTVSREPYQAYFLSIQFDCKPERAANLKSSVYAEIDNLIKNGVKKDEIDKIVKNINKENEQSKEHNSYWMNIIYNYYKTGININNPKNSSDILNSLSAKDVQNYAKRLFKAPDIVDITFIPNK